MKDQYSAGCLCCLNTCLEKKKKHILNNIVYESFQFNCTNIISTVRI